MHSAGQSSLNVFISPPREGEWGRKNCHSCLSGGITRPGGSESVWYNSRRHGQSLWCERAVTRGCLAVLKVSIILKKRVTIHFELPSPQTANSMVGGTFSRIERRLAVSLQHRFPQHWAEKWAAEMTDRPESESSCTHNITDTTPKIKLMHVGMTFFHALAWVFCRLGPVSAKS